MIRIDLTRQDADNPDRKKRHPGRAICEVSGYYYEASSPAPIYKLVTLLWLHGHDGERFEVHDDRDPFGRLGGLAMMGRVRNWARVVKDKPKFDKDAAAEADFSSQDREIIVQAAGRVVDLGKTDSPRPDNAHTGATRLSGSPSRCPAQERASAGGFTATKKFQTSRDFRRSSG